MPGSELAVCRSSVPWLRITHKGSDCVVPLGSNKTTWNFLKSVEPMSWLKGQGSSASGTLSWSKSSKHSSPLPSPVKDGEACDLIFSNRGEMYKLEAIIYKRAKKGFCITEDGFSNISCVIDFSTESYNKSWWFPTVTRPGISGDINRHKTLLRDCKSHSSQTSQNSFLRQNQINNSLVFVLKRIFWATLWKYNKSWKYLKFWVI